jgi:hypothetical protein
MNFTGFIGQHHIIFGLSAILLVFFLVKLGAIDKIWAMLARGPEESVIASEDFSRSRQLQNMASGKIDGDYIYYLYTNKAGRVMFEVFLDHDTRLHIVAIGVKSGLGTRVQYHTNRHWLESVSLEGNFPQDFRMWCTKDKQIEVRQVFGPETMAQFGDFCRAYNFELFNNKLYISVAEQDRDQRDTTSMVTDITNFIVHNRPVFDHLR